MYFVFGTDNNMCCLLLSRKLVGATPVVAHETASLSETLLFVSLSNLSAVSDIKLQASNTFPLHTTTNLSTPC